MNGSTGADRNGFSPFPGSFRFPGPDAAPGPLSQWIPYFTDICIAYNYAALLARNGDKSVLQGLAAANISDKV